MTGVPSLGRRRLRAQQQGREVPLHLIWPAGRRPPPQTCAAASSAPRWPPAWQTRKFQSLGCVGGIHGYLITQWKSRECM